VCHQAKTNVENKRRLDKLYGIERSPTAPVELEDASTTYDVDTQARGKAYVDLPWTPADIIFIEAHFAEGTGALVHPQTLEALTVPQLRQRMIDDQLPNAESRTRNQLSMKCGDMRELIVDGRYKYPDRARGVGKGHKCLFSPREVAFIDDHRGRLTSDDILQCMKDKFPESQKRNLASVRNRLSKMNKNEKGKPSLEQITFVEKHMTTAPTDLLRLLNAKFPGGYTYSKTTLNRRLEALKKSGTGGGGGDSSSTGPASRSGGAG